MNAINKVFKLLSIPHTPHAALTLRHPGFPEGFPAPRLPAVDIHNGLNKNDLHDPTVPVAVQVVFQQDMDIGDLIVLWVNDTAVGTQYLNQDHESTRAISFYVPPEHFPDGPCEVHYHHSTPLGGNETSSLINGPFTVRRLVPGNPDPNPSTPYINENLLAPTGIPALVDTSRPLAVNIPRYQYINEGDVITLYWTGVAIPHTVTLAEAQNPALPLTIQVPVDVLVANPGIGLVVTYDIRDIVKNWSLFSPEATTEVEVPGSLTAPAVRDADDYDVLDVDQLAGGEVVITVPVNGNLTVPNRIRLTWRGQPVMGPAIEHTVEHTISAASARFTVRLPNAVAAALVGSTATVFYDAYLDTTPRRSARTTVGIVGQPITLEKPSLTGVTGDTYNPGLITGTHQEVIVPAYSFMAVGDSVTLNWLGLTAGGGAIPTSQTVTITDPAQVGRPISFLVEKIFATALAGGSLRVTYSVSAGGQSYPSPALELTVVGVITNLLAPTTEPAFPGGDVDLSSLEGPNIQVVIARQDEVLKPGDAVTLFWEGSNSGQHRVNLVYPIAGIADLRTTLGITPYLDANLNGSVDVWYEVRRAGVLVASSLELNLRVRQSVETPWPLPKVEDATGSEANPINPIRPGSNNQPNTATVVVLDSRILAADVIGLVWMLPDDTNLTIPWLDAPAGGGRLPVPDSVLTASMGKTVRVAYTIFRKPNMDVIGTSAVLNLQVLQIATGVLPTPEMPDADPNTLVLDVSQLTADAKVRIPVWPRIAAGQRVWLRLYGEGDNGALPAMVLANGVEVGAGEVATGFERYATLAQLQALKDGSELRVEAKVNFEGSNAEAQAVPFALTTLTVASIAIVTPSITSVKDARNVEIPNAGSTTSTSITLSGKASINQRVEVFDGTTSKGVATANASGDWTLPVTGLTVAAHSFTAKGLYGNNPTSPPRTLTVVSLVIAPGVMTLNGRVIRAPAHWTKIGGAFAGNTGSRAPTGGTPPYRYASNSPTIASVDPNSGLVTGLRNGTAVITVTDQNNSTASYTVSVSNVFNLHVKTTSGSYHLAVNWMNSLGGMGLVSTDISLMLQHYAYPFPHIPSSDWYWLGPICTSEAAVVYNYISNEQRCWGYAGSMQAYCLVSA